MIPLKASRQRGCSLRALGLDQPEHYTVRITERRLGQQSVSPAASGTSNQGLLCFIWRASMIFLYALALRPGRLWEAKDERGRGEVNEL